MMNNEVRGYPIVFLFFASAVFQAAWATEKAHVHGSASMTLALETSKKGEVSYDIPAESVFGFEHEAKSAKDKATVESSLKTLKIRASEIIAFPESAKCAVSKAKAEIEKEEHEGHDHHEDVSGSFEFSCENTLENAKVTIGLMKLFPKMRKVSFQALGTSKQLKKDVNSATQEVALGL